MEDFEVYDKKRIDAANSDFWTKAGILTLIELAFQIILSLL